MNNRLLKEIINFGWVGVLCFVIDFGLLYIITNFLGVNYLISASISFSCSVVINYILSIKYVFDVKENTNKIKELFIFICLSAVGLGINQVIMWLGVEKLILNYMFVKIGATGIVMVYNFITRKIVIAK